MRRALRSIAHLLIAILLATVLSPSFGWEATVGQSGHGHDIVSAEADGDTHGADMHAGSRHGDEDNHQHHSCAGHSFGDLPGHLCETLSFAMPDLDHDRFPRSAARFPSPFPDRLYRPPLAPPLA
jgi:hypothetical protein